MIKKIKKGYRFYRLKASKKTSRMRRLLGKPKRLRGNRLKPHLLGKSKS